MNCKKCGKPIEDGITVCPGCGEEVQKPINGKKLALVIGGAVLAVAIVVAIVLAIVLPGKENPDPTEAPADPTVELDLNATEETPEGTRIPTAEELEAHPVLGKNVYTPAEGESVDLDAAVITIGDVTLTNREFSVWYWQTYYDLLNNLGYYATIYGLDSTKPLSEQSCLLADVEMSWEQFMVEQALVNWHSYQAMVAEAEKAGVTLSQEDMTDLEGMEADMAETATAYGYESVAAMLEADYGAGVTFADYKNFVYTLMLGNEYYAQQQQALTPTDQEVSDYFDQYAADYAENGVEKGVPSTIDVRHILLQPVTAAAEDGTYTEDQMKDAWAQAEKVLEQWKNGEATEESFAALAKENTTDPGSKETGGLYEDVAPGDMVQAFNDWCFDPVRKPGDVDLVETNYGVHVMYFVAASETEYWYECVLSDLINDRMQAMVEKAMDDHPYEVDYEKLMLTRVAAAETAAE